MTPSASWRPRAGVQQQQLAGARHAVMPRDHAHHGRGMAGNGAGPVHGVGPIGAAAVVFHLPGAVGIHAEQHAAEIVRQIGVFPTGVEHAAVVEHDRVPIVVLVERHAVLVAAVGVEDVQVAHVGLARAGHRLLGGVQRAEDAAVGQIAAVVMGDGRIFGRNAARRAAVDVHLPQRRGRRKTAAAGRPNSGPCRSPGPCRSVVCRPSGRTGESTTSLLAEPVGAGPIAGEAGVALDDQQLAEGQQRRIQQHLALGRVEILFQRPAARLGRGVAGEHAVPEVGHAAFQAAMRAR